MTFKQPDSTYWDNKFAAYMHDPLDKIFKIPGHEERAAELLEIFGLQLPNQHFWKKADGIASGFERGQVPSYSRNSNENGAVNFMDEPFITHPTSTKACLKIEMNTDSASQSAQEIHEDLIRFIKENIGMRPGEGGYSDAFENDPDGFAYARFLYTHLALRFKLAGENVAGIGTLWHRLPADSRFPDHTIWQHNALTSALYSCMASSEGENQVGMMVASITPVQPFIARARKLRDFQTGSVLLAWLAFEGLCWVMENLGPDHVLYPSLIDQPLINEYLSTKWYVNGVVSLNSRRDIASLPNKFLFLVPLEQAKAIGAGIAARINNAWGDLCDRVEKQLIDTCGAENEHIHTIFKRQNSHFWDIQWAAAKLLDVGDKPAFENLLPEKGFSNPLAVFEIFNQLVKDQMNFDMDSRGMLYTATHALVQSALASQKTKQQVRRAPENGEKCHLCGEFEVVHGVRHTSDQSASEYNGHINRFWKNLKTQWETDFGKNEKLCSICMVKRIAYRVLKKEKEHLLNNSFAQSEGFPSTTEMAVHNYFKRKGINDKTERKKIAQAIHEESIEKTDNRDCYYAILLMDGDHMGKLVNGETLASTWKSCMHPEIVQRLQNPGFNEAYHNVWQKIFDHYPQRILTPSIHAAISEALGDFAMYGVAAIIEQFKGRLIYAGGDDVCAVLPVDLAFDAAEAIRKYYISEFKLINGNASQDVKDNWRIEPGKLSLNLGRRKDISISAGIMICHHKESLSKMIEETHHLLDNQAKTEAGRNACAIELRKRSGGSRFFVRKWEDHAWHSFQRIGALISNKNKQQVSASLVYRLAEFEDGIQAILKHDNHRELLIKFFKKQLERSSLIVKKGMEDDLAGNIADIVVTRDKKYAPEGLIVAAFIADKGGE